MKKCLGPVAIRSIPALQCPDLVMFIFIEESWTNVGNKLAPVSQKLIFLLAKVDHAELVFE